MKEYMMKQKEFADHLSVDSKTYGMWERGKSCPNLELAFKICKKINKDCI